MRNKDAYSYPKYCDIAYNWDRTHECDFIEECIRRYSGVKVDSILDIACATGIHLREFARRGYDVMGLDRSKQMVKFVISKARAEGLNLGCLQSDMRSFKLARTEFGCAICMLDSFRYLLTDKDIKTHLKSVAAALKAGGLYIVDIWMPQGETVTEWEDISWSQQDGEIKIDAVYRQHAGTYNGKNKTFDDELVFKVKSPDFNSTLVSKVKTRALFYREFKALINDSGLFDLIGRFYNFDFDLKERYNNKQIRTNIVLKKRRI